MSLFANCRRSVAAAALILTLGVWSALSLCGDVGAPAKAADQPAIPFATKTVATAVSEEKPSYSGSSNCQRCHSNPIEQDRTEGRTYFLRMNESQTWSLHDRHSQAFALLTCTRGQEMSKKLGYDVTKDQRCLSCHANWQTKRDPVPTAAVLAEGVACEACHGPSSKYINDHSDPNKKWREIPFDVRLQQYGMITVRDPQQRAEICLSCHVGSADEGKVVTHDMYAAGHPPMPSFELSDFCEAMPRHWDDIRTQLVNLQKDQPANAAKTTEDLKRFQKQLGNSDGTLPVLKSVLAGAAMTLRQSAQLVADQAGGKVRHVGDAATAPNENGSAGSVWPEFALYDCSMCHHELRYPGWRQQRTALAPGRPLIPRWPETLVGVAIEQLAGSDRAAAAAKKQRFAKLLDNLDDPFRRQPFGDPADIAVPAKKLTEFLNRELLEPLKSAKCDQQAATAALRQLCDAATEKTPDFDSARQLAWAFQSIYQELKDAKSTGGNLPNAAWDAIDRELAALNAELRLTINPLRPAAKNVGEQALTDAELQATIDCATAYSPQQFQQHFRALSAKLATLGQ